MDFQVLRGFVYEHNKLHRAVSSVIFDGPANTDCKRQRLGYVQHRRGDFTIRLIGRCYHGVQVSIDLDEFQDVLLLVRGK